MAASNHVRELRVRWGGNLAHLLTGAVERGRWLHFRTAAFAAAPKGFRGLSPGDLEGEHWRLNSASERPRSRRAAAGLPGVCRNDFVTAWVNSLSTGARN